MSDLKPCPFCGGKARLNEYKDGEVWYEVWCDECAVRTEQYETVDEAVKVWNRRTERIARVVHSDVFGDWKNMCGNCFEAGKKMGLFHEQKYCYECGCKLDWSDDE